MPTPTKGPRLGGGPAHERWIIANLARSLFQEERLRTTEAKAKRLRPHAERLITFAKRGDLHARRQVLTVVRDKDVVKKLFNEIAPRYASRPGGYTRILKLGPRPGDGAPMVLIELVDREEQAAPAAPEQQAGRGRRRLRRRSAEAAPVEPVNRAQRRAAARQAAAAAPEAAAAGEEPRPDVPTDAELEAGAEEAAGTAAEAKAGDEGSAGDDAGGEQQRS